MDIPNLSGSTDRSGRKSVSFDTPQEAHYWSKVFECTEQEARLAVQAVGASVAACRLYLKNKAVIARREEQNRFV